MTQHPQKNLFHTFKLSTLSILTALSLTVLSGNTSIAAQNSAKISRGQYLAYAGDCMACHTSNPDKPYAGGHGLASPLGIIYATNITPDKTHGIGHYTLEEFDQAVREGISKNHGPLYPAMPFVSYAKMSDEDIAALYNYFMNEVTALYLE